MAEKAKMTAAQSDDRTPNARSGAPAPAMIGSAVTTGAAVREPGASPGRSRRCEGRRSPRRNATGPRRAGKAAREGAPSQKTCRLPVPNPSRKEDSCVTDVRSFSLPFSVALCALAPAALGATVTVRVEGKTPSIFGSPVNRSSADERARRRSTLASTLGEFYYQVTQTSFGTYVSQIGRYPASGATGWVFKVNGVSPPVGADQVSLKDGDEVLWYYATFGATGGPPTLQLKAAGGNCYLVASVERPGQGRLRQRAPRCTVDGRRFRTGAGRACVGKHVGARAGVRSPAPSGRTPEE